MEGIASTVTQETFFQFIFVFIWKTIVHVIILLYSRPYIRIYSKDGRTTGTVAETISLSFVWWFLLSYLFFNYNCTKPRPFVMALVLNLVVSLYLGYIMLGYWVPQSIFNVRSIHFRDVLDYVLYHDTSRESAMIVREVVIYVRNLVVELATSDDGWERWRLFVFR